MLTTKTRKHSGRYTPKGAGTIPNQEKHEELIPLPEEEYDDWIERRDGMRYDADKTHIRCLRMSYGEEEKIKKENNKLIKKTKIRKARRKKGGI